MGSAASFREAAYKVLAQGRRQASGSPFTRKNGRIKLEDQIRRALPVNGKLPARRGGHQPKGKREVNGGASARRSRRIGVLPYDSSAFVKFDSNDRCND
jgi:hypothetical protein